MKTEATNNYAEKITDARWRTAKAVGVSESTVTRILRERKAYESALSTSEFHTANEINLSREQHISEQSTSYTADPSTSVAHAIPLTEEVAVDSRNYANTDLVGTNSAIFTSPMKKRRVTPRKINLDEFDIAVVRRSIENYHKEHKQFPTLFRLKNILQERIQFNGCKTTLRTLLLKLGYERKIIERR